MSITSAASPIRQTDSMRERDQHVASASSPHALGEAQEVRAVQPRVYPCQLAWQVDQIGG